MGDDVHLRNKNIAGKMEMEKGDEFSLGELAFEICIQPLYTQFKLEIYI